MVGLIWCIITHDKWKSTPLKYAMKFGPFWNKNGTLGKFPEIQRLSRRCRRTVQRLVVTVTPFGIAKTVTVSDFHTIHLPIGDCKNCHCKQFPGNLKRYKFSPNFMAYFRGVVSHFSWLMIHQNKSTTYGYYHAKWF